MLKIRERDSSSLLTGAGLRLLAVQINQLLESIPMRTAKSRIAVSIANLCIVMLMYSPLCSLSCALNSCVFSKAGTAKPDEQPHHCRGSQEPQEESSTPGKIPSAPLDDSGDCPSHVNLIAALPVKVNANVESHQVLHPVSVEPAIIAVLYFDRRGEIRAEEMSFKSPPARAINSVLRI